VVSKIVKHGQETNGNATGLLVGIDLNGTLEVSNCFALPPGAADADEERQARSGRYQAAMLRALKDIQRDDQPVGFYQTCRFGAFLSGGFIELATRHGQLRHGGIAVIHGERQIERLIGAEFRSRCDTECAGACEFESVQIEFEFPGSV